MSGAQWRCRVELSEQNSETNKTSQLSPWTMILHRNEGGYFETWEDSVPPSETRIMEITSNERRAHAHTLTDYTLGSVSVYAEREQSRFQKVEQNSPSTQSIHLRIREGLWLMSCIVKLCCSQSFVPRALFRIVIEPQTTSNCSSFVVMFPGMVCRIFVLYNWFTSQ